MKAENKKFIPIAMLVIGAAFVYGNGKGTSLGPATLFSIGPGGASITWETTEVGQDQQVERTATLVNPDWQPVGDAIIADGTNTVVDSTDPLPPAGFYRIRLIEE